jgi:multidrug efflux pump subunit AcrA (membrane-fusion protein)
MADLKFKPVAHNHAKFMARAKRKPGFSKAYVGLGLEYALAGQMLGARAKACLSQHVVGGDASNELSAKPCVPCTAATPWPLRLTALALALSLSACGLETAATAASAAKLQAQQAQAAQQQLDAARQQLEQANAQLEARKQQMDAAAQ